MKRTLKKYATNEYGQRAGYTVDVRPLNQRETKMDNRKGMLPAENEKKPVTAIVQLPLFGNPFNNDILLPATEVNPALDNSLHPDDPDSLLPDYVKHRAKLGYEVL